MRWPLCFDDGIVISCTLSAANSRSKSMSCRCVRALPLFLLGLGMWMAGPLLAQSLWDGSGDLPRRALNLVLPTGNSALFHGDGPGFYQYTDRRMQPRIAPPWEGGRYGFVRNFLVTKHGPVYTRFHEGIDIRALERASERDEPRDRVRSIDEGVVVYVNRSSRRSNYGNYIVVEHWWSGSPFYSLYAHLGTVNVAIGQEVGRGEAVGVLGYSGIGINRRRAHLHLEVNLLLNRSFHAWHDEHYGERDPNYHGIYNGINLAGVDVAGLLLQARDSPGLSMRRFLAEQEGFFTVVAPGEGMPDMLWRYPWLSPDLEGWTPIFGPMADFGVAWRITFTRSGLPLRFDALREAVTDPVVHVLEPSPIPYRYLTNGLVTGAGNSPSLSAEGKRYLDLLLRPSPDLRGTAW